MTAEELSRFVNEVIRSHELATGLKPLVSHEEIVDYAQRQGFDFNLNQWNSYFQTDFAELSDSIQQKVLAAQTSHWSWAFRQISAWRAMLMEGADTNQS